MLDFLAPETDWLDIRYCADDDDDTFYRELPEAQVIWHVLRPISGDDLEASDIVSVHLPLTERTAGMLDRAALARMKPDAVVVNTSRGGVIDEVALVDALRTSGLAAAGLDVFAVEPIPADNPLLGLDNVTLTPHVTWYTADTMRRYLEYAVDNCRRIRDGRELANVVNR